MVTGDNVRNSNGDRPRKPKLTTREERDILEAALAPPALPPEKRHSFVFDRRNVLIFVTIAIAVALRIWLTLNLPLRFLTYAVQDDALFMRHGESLLTGHWLGSYSDLTLVKGPGYPWFLAVASLTGMPISLAHVVFQLMAIALLAWVAFRLTASSTLAVILFIALVLYPAGYSPVLQRVIRDQIYWAQTLLTLALFMIAFAAPLRSRATTFGVALVAGLALGWTWLTREEGVWLVPGLAVLVLGGIFLNGTRHTIGRMMAAVFAFLVVLGLFRTLNYVAYGSFVGVEVKSGSFEDAMNAIQSVQIGKRPYIPVSTEARDAIARVSPTFAPIAEKLAPGSPMLKTWSKPGCLIYKSTCDDISGGWSMWSIRAAARQVGYYESPAIASRKYEMIAEDIHRACASGALPCRASSISLMAWTPGLFNRLPVSFFRVIEKVAFWKPDHGRVPSLAYPAADSEAAKLWSFLNYPRIAVASVNPVEKAAIAVRSVMLGIYGTGVPVLAAVGLFAALLSLTRLKRVLTDPVMLAATATWALVAARAIILALIDASSFPAANLLYAAPANFCLVLASFLSIVAALRGLRNA